MIEKKTYKVQKDYISWRKYIFIRMSALKFRMHSIIIARHRLSCWRAFLRVLLKNLFHFVVRRYSEETFFQWFASLVKKLDVLEITRLILK